LTATFVEKGKTSGKGRVLATTLLRFQHQPLLFCEVKRILYSQDDWFFPTSV